MSLKEENRPEDVEIDGLTAAELEAQHPADAAEAIEGLDLTDQIKFIKQLPVKDAALSLAEMETHDQKDIIQNLNRGLAGRIVAQMSPDDATDLLDELDYELQQALLRRVPAEERAELKTLLTFDPDTAGGVMNTEVVILDQDLNVDLAITKIREEVEDKEIPYYAYLTDEKDRLVGVVSLRDILLARRGAMLKDLVKTQSLVTVGIISTRKRSRISSRTITCLRFLLSISATACSGLSLLMMLLTSFMKKPVKICRRWSVPVPMKPRILRGCIRFACVCLG